MRNHVVDKLFEIAKQDDRIILITGDLGFGVLTKFWEELPDQYLNVGVAEQNMTAVAAGLAMEGFIPFTYSIGNFPTLRCLEQIRNDVCYHDLNVNVVAVGGGFSYGSLGMSHHATEDLSIMRAIPNIDVIAPSEPWQAADLVQQMINRDGPSYLRIDKGGGDIARKNGEKSHIGAARIIGTGTDLAIFTAGAVLKEANEAKAALEKENIGVRLIDLVSLKPLDTVAVCTSIRETKCFMTVEENTIIGGLYGAICETVMREGLPQRPSFPLGLNDEYSSIVGSQKYLRKHYKMDSKSILKTAKNLLKVR